MIHGLLGQLGPVIMFRSEMEATVGLGVLKTWGEPSAVEVKEKTPEPKYQLDMDTSEYQRTLRPCPHKEYLFKKVENEADPLSRRCNEFDKRIAELENRIR